MNGQGWLITIGCFFAGMIPGLPYLIWLKLDSRRMDRESGWSRKRRAAEKAESVRKTDELIASWWKQHDDLRRELLGELSTRLAGSRSGVKP